MVFLSCIHISSPVDGRVCSIDGGRSCEHCSQKWDLSEFLVAFEYFLYYLGRLSKFNKYFTENILLFRNIPAVSIVTITAQQTLQFCLSRCSGVFLTSIIIIYYKQFSVY
jgi:hypothetical protein